jgi:exodeoxyribonuclease VII large subunit
MTESPSSQPQVLTVSQLNKQIRDALLERFPSIWVGGEITDLSRPRSGHLYFSLKDDSSQLNAVMWRNVAARLKFSPDDGMDVLCRGEVDVYPPRGTYQLIVREIELRGEGALQAALRRMREKLAAEGLFDAGRKRALPAFPRRLAVVTSPSGAALRDFLEVVRRRWQGIQVIVVPTRVQGADAAPEIVAAIQGAARLRPAVDAILVTRGGGSLEDLWCFNDEQVVRAIHAAPVPVVSAVGHEIDVTLADLAADVRALTPSEAGERLVPAAAEIHDRLRNYQRQLLSLLRARRQYARSQLETLAASRVLQDPMWLLRDHERTLDDLQQRSTRAVRRRAELANSEVAQLVASLEPLSPLHVLGRGYAIALDGAGNTVRSTVGLRPGDDLHVRLRDGTLATRVREIRRHSPSGDTPDMTEEAQSDGT